MSSSPKKKGGFRWDDVRIFYDDLNTMMMEIMMMTKYDDDERVGKRIRGRRNWPDSGAAGEAEEIRRRPRWGRRIWSMQERPPGKTGFLKMTASKRTCNSARLRDVKGGHSRDEDKTAALAASKADMNLT